MRRARKLLALSGEERGLLLEALLLVPLTRAALWLLPVRRVRRLGEGLGRPAPPRPDRPETADRIAWAVAAVSRWVPQASCLTQALAAEVMLRRRSIPGRVHIGVTRGAQGFGAHAWVEVSGRAILGGEPDERLVPLLVLKPAEASERSE